MTPNQIKIELLLHKKWTSILREAQLHQAIM